MIATASEAAAGDRIGPYKLLQCLGEGGMGTVWQAEQSEPVRRTVAVKLIKAGMDSKEVLGRFEAERQALALMDHPNIARVLDGGVTPGGRPFFVMELVRGVPITKYCDDARLTPRQRLELFIPVCQAVQHAHQKGIIHRDLKPANVLVALHDSKPVPKVIDFGVAKAVHRPLTEQTIFTELGMVVGTPEYMAPEQAEVNCLDIDTRADIYSLGVILYELLTGGPPFDRKQLQSAALAEMLRIIREVEPPKPSTRLSLSQELPTLATARQLDPRRLTSTVRGELDWIVMKCLEKERSRRYETTNGLVMDVQRYLADEPVLAGPPSKIYRVKKFVRRNKGPMAAAALVLLTLIGGMIGTTWQARRADSERDRAETEKQTAQTREAETKAVLDFVQDKIIGAARPEGQDGGLGYKVTLRDALEKALPFVARQFRDQPLIEARLRTTLGTSFFYLGDAKTAAEQYESARALYWSSLGPDQPDTLASMTNLANGYYALGRYADALNLYEETLALHKAKLGPDHPATVISMNNLANCYQTLGRHADALKLHEKTLSLRKARLGPDHADTLLSMNSLANSYAALGRRADALRLREGTLALRKASLGPDHPDTLISMNNLAASYSDFGRNADALKLYEETLALKKAKLGPDHPETLRAFINLASCYAAIGRNADALRIYEETLKLQKATLGPGHPDTLLAMYDLAISYSAVGRHADALKLFEETLSLQKAKLGADHPDTLRIEMGMASSYAALGRHADALKLREETLALQKASLGPDHPDTLLSMWGLIESLIVLNRGAEAVPIIDDCLKRAAGNAVHPQLIPTVMELRLQHFEKAKDAAGCQATAEMWEKLNRTDANSLYDAACFRAVTAAVVSQTAGAEPTRLASVEGDRAMAWLKQSITAGYQDIPHLLADTDLAPLRHRPDYADLLWDLADMPAAASKP